MAKQRTSNDDFPHLWWQQSLSAVSLWSAFVSSGVASLPSSSLSDEVLNGSILEMLWTCATEPVAEPVLSSVPVADPVASFASVASWTDKFWLSSEVGACGSLISGLTSPTIDASGVVGASGSLISGLTFYIYIIYDMYYVR